MQSPNARPSPSFPAAVSIAASLSIVTDLPAAVIGVLHSAQYAGGADPNLLILASDGYLIGATYAEVRHGSA